jgi:MPBQ/MSBQ methyltransferase
VTGEDRVAAHYDVTDLGGKIERALLDSGKDLDALAVEDLAPVDAFHIRGRRATQELAAWAEIRPEDRVIDVGCGLGGTGRYLAAAIGCRTTGIDLSEENCRAATMLSVRLGLGDRTAFKAASALALPFPDAAFDVALTEHVQMNIADKAGFYGEMYRVLGAGGRLAFNDVFAGEAGDVHYPVPWAADASISHLVSVDDLRRLLVQTGFQEVRWADTTAESIAFFRKVTERLEAQGWLPLGLHLVMGGDGLDKFRNMLRSLEENRIRVVQAVHTRT